MHYCSKMHSILNIWDAFNCEKSPKAVSLLSLVNSSQNTVNFWHSIILVKNSIFYYIIVYKFTKFRSKGKQCLYLAMYFFTLNLLRDYNLELFSFYHDGYSDTWDVGRTPRTSKRRVNIYGLFRFAQLY